MGAYELYVKIMPLGDSNTRGHSGYCYRAFLKEFLQDDGWEVDFVGSVRDAQLPVVNTLYGPGPSGGMAWSRAPENTKYLLGHDLSGKRDFEHEGWGARPTHAFLGIDNLSTGDFGFKQTKLTVETKGFNAYKHEHVIEEKLRYSDPEIIMVMLGTNDRAVRGINPDINDLDILVNRIHNWIEQNGGHENRKLLVATIPPMKSQYSSVSSDYKITVINKFSTDWTNKVDALVNVYESQYEDKYPGKDLSDYFRNNETDYWHFKMEGYEIMGYEWYKSIIKYLTSQ
jgi:lysophospholipase L1-like esterase